MNIARWNPLFQGTYPIVSVNSCQNPIVRPVCGDRDGLALVRPSQRRGRPVVLLDELLTPADEVVLTTTTPA